MTNQEKYYQLLGAVAKLLPSDKPFTKEEAMFIMAGSQEVRDLNAFKTLALDPEAEWIEQEFPQLATGRQ